MVAQLPGTGASLAGGAGDEALQGPGVVEAGCKTIIGFQLKQSGMRWTVRGANAIIALRCAELSGRWEEFWEARAAS